MFQAFVDWVSRRADKALASAATAPRGQTPSLVPTHDLPHEHGGKPATPDGQARIWRAADLDEFVARSDALGGPDASETQAFWQGFRYQPQTEVDTRLDPVSEAYVDQQVRLWEELSGRRFNQDINELCDFPFDEHLKAANPYASRDVSTFARHLASLTEVAIAADLPPAPRVLDLGCGWGLTSEVFAFLGADVTAMDIGQGFVDLINARAGRSGMPIQAHRSTFEAFEPYAVFDMALFYECLHHAVRPWQVLGRFRHHLSQGGKIVLAREPVQHIWWPHWGMRLDPLSIYCMRKFGWFESGFSRAFLQTMATHLGLEVQERPDPHGSAPLYLLHFPAGYRHAYTTLPLNSLVNPGLHEGWAQEADGRLVAEARVTINLSACDGNGYLELELANVRGKPVKISLQRGDSPPVNVILRSGTNILRTRKEGILVIQGETWRPSDELNLPDPRAISFHVTRAETYSLAGP